VESPKLRRADRALQRPVRTVLGLTGKGRSPTVERALTDFGADRAFGRAETAFQEHYGFDIGRTTILRVVEARADQAAAYVTDRLATGAAAYDLPLATRPGVAAQLTGLDGCEIRTGTLVPAGTDEVTPVRGLPKRKRVEAWKDVRMGMVRELGSDSPKYVGHLGPYPEVEVVEQLFRLAVAEGLSERTAVFGIGDGGLGLMEELKAQFPGLQYVLDYYHGQSHLHETAAAMGLQDDAKTAWVQRATALMWSGHVATVIQELWDYQGPGQERVENLRNHLTRFRDCVHYAAYQAAGVPIGSGEVESCHKTIPQARLKLAGTWWRLETVNTMLALRIVRANGWWEDFWSTATSVAA
jgi:hypothetical protein